MKRLKTILILFVCVTCSVKAKSDSLTVITSWDITDNYTRPLPRDVDTNLPGFQIYHQAYQAYDNITFLGNVGSPVISNNFTERNREDYPFFLKPYLPYFQTMANTHYYNTKKPFSRMSYSYGPANANKEQTFEALHTQNVNPNLNFGLRYHNISSRGQYPDLHVKKNSFRIFTSYSGERYTAHSAFNFNRSNAGESGGLERLDLFNVGDYDNSFNLTSRVGTNLNDKTSKVDKTIRYYDFLFSQKIKLFTLSTKVDTSAPTKGTVAEPILTHIMKMDRASMFHRDITGTGSGIYDNYYFNTTKSVDTIINYKVSNAIQLEFKSTFRQKVQTGIYGLIGHEYEKFQYRSEWDTTWVPADTTLTPYLDKIDTLKGVGKRFTDFNVFLSAGIYGNIKNKIKTNLSTTVYIAGYKSGQSELKGVLNTNFNMFNEEFNFDLEGIIENRKPHYLLNNYYSNNFIWNDTLNAENSILLSSVIGSPSKRFEVKANYYLLSNYIYFDTLARPANFEGILNYASIEATKTFKVWKITSINKVVLQFSENQKVLPLPQLIAYNSSYIDHTFKFNKTGGKIQAILGIDVTYNSKFYVYDYAPALSQFYVQNIEKAENLENREIGNYPLFDAYLNVKLKKVRFFIKSEHFNSYIKSYIDDQAKQRYFSAFRYPYNPLSIKLGISWVFYD